MNYVTTHDFDLLKFTSRNNQSVVGFTIWQWSFETWVAYNAVETWTEIKLSNSD